MISSVNGSSAISSASPQATEVASPVETVKKSSSSSTAHGNKGSSNQLRKLVRSESAVVSDASNDLSNVDNSNIAIKNNANVAYLKQKSGSSDDSADLAITYGQKTESDDEETYYPQDTSYIPTSFAELAAMVGGAGVKVTKDQLTSYLEDITSGSSSASAAEITVIKNLIARFEALSGGEDYITSMKGVNDTQDYTTVTPAQVTSPVDIRV